jgi:hypothetical protein
VTVAPWKFGTTGGKPTWFTDAGAEVTHSKGEGVACTRCKAPPQRVTTTLELIAFLTRHLDCRPPWARKATP